MSSFSPNLASVATDSSRTAAVARLGKKATKANNKKNNVNVLRIGQFNILGTVDFSKYKYRYLNGKCQYLCQNIFKFQKISYSNREARDGIL